jgi:hypothetical protein
MSAWGQQATSAIHQELVRFTPQTGHLRARHADQQRAITGLMRRSRVPPSITSWALESYSGNPAFRRPSINSFEFDCPPRPIHAEIVKAGSVSSRRAAASRASASRPR